MRKSILLLIAFSFYGVSAFAELPSATYVKKISTEATKKAYKELLSSKKGKEVYKNLMSIFEKNIMKVANEGFYDTLNITIFNSGKLGIKKEMKKLSKKEQDLMRQLIIHELQKKGYKIGYHQYWDNPGEFAIKVSW